MGLLLNCHSAKLDSIVSTSNPQWKSLVFKMSEVVRGTTVELPTKITISIDNPIFTKLQPGNIYSLQLDVYVRPANGKYKESLNLNIVDVRPVSAPAPAPAPVAPAPAAK